MGSQVWRDAVAPGTLDLVLARGATTTKINASDYGKPTSSLADSNTPRII